MTRLAPVIALAAAFTALAAAAPAAQSAPAMKIKVIGWAGVYKNKAHTVSTPNGGVLRRCDEPTGISVVVEVANIQKGLPYQISWSFNGKTVETKNGTMGSFDAVPDKVYSGYRTSTLADGAYRWKIAVAGKVRATAKVTRRCA